MLQSCIDQRPNNPVGAGLTGGVGVPAMCVEEGSGGAGGGGFRGAAPAAAVLAA